MSGTISGKDAFVASTPSASAAGIVDTAASASAVKDTKTTTTTATGIGTALTPSAEPVKDSKKEEEEYEGKRVKLVASVTHIIRYVQNMDSHAKIVLEMQGLPGLLVAFEGLDRSGKTTQATLLVDYLNELKENSAVLMRFPDRTTLTGKAIDICLKNTKEAGGIHGTVLALLFAAERVERAADIRALLKAGTTVVCDRYSAFGAAYANANGEDLDWALGLDDGIPKPDITFFMWATPKELMDRRGYGEEAFAYLLFQEKVWRSYQSIITRVIDSGKEWWRPIDSLRDTRTQHAEVIGRMSLCIYWHFQKHRGLRSEDKDLWSREERYSFPPWA